MNRFFKGIIAVLLYLLSLSPLGAQTLDTESFQGRVVAAHQAIVRFSSGDFLQSQSIALQDVDIESVESLGSTGAVLLRSKDRSVSELVQAYGSRTDVVYAQPNYALDVGSMPDLTAMTAALSQVVRPSIVAIADTGLVPEDPQLAGLLWVTPSPFSLDVAGHHIECPAGTHGFDAFSGTCEPSDLNGHGTEVAHLVADSIGALSAGDGSLRIMGLRFTDANGRGFTSHALAALEFARKVKSYFGGDGGAASLGVLVEGWADTSQNRVLHEELELVSNANIKSLAAVSTLETSSAGMGSLAVSPEDDSGTVTTLANDPTLTSLSPSNGVRGTSVDVTLTGTNFSDPVVSISAGSGITFQNVAFVNTTTVTATFVIDAAAPIGTHQVSVTFSDGTTPTVNFTVVPQAPTLTAIVPTSGSQNQTISVALTGTNFVPGMTIEPGADITVTNLIVTSSTDVTAKFTISSLASLGDREVKVVTAGGTSEGVTFTVLLPPPPTITAISPDSGVLDSIVPVTLTGTNFVPDLTVDTGSGITVSEVAYLGPTQARATLTIDAGATVGVHDLTVTTSGGTSGTIPFNVVAVPPVLESLSPVSGPVGAAVTVTLTGLNFSSGLSVNPIAGITVSGLSVTNTTTAQAIFTIDPAADLGPRDVSVTAANGTSGTVVFSVNPPVPTLTLIDPTSGVAGSNVDITLTGTNFVSGLTIDVGEDITASNIVITNSTTATATLAIGASVTPGLRLVRVTTAGGTSPITTVVFNVIPLPPTLTAINPVSVVQSPLRRSFNVVLTGTDLYTPIINVSGTGVTASGANVDGTTTATATFTVDANAEIGPRDVTVTTTGGVSGAVTFTVLPPVPVLSSITPAIGVRGTQVSVTLTGMNFVGGSTTVNSIADVTVSDVTVVNSTSITATFAVAAGAPLGPHDVTVTTVWGTTSAVPFLVADPFPDLSITSSHSANFGVGFDETYLITVMNEGSLETSGPTTVTDTLPTGFTFVSGVGSGWSCAAAGQVVTCTFAGVLPANATSDFTLTVAVAAPAVGTQNHTVSVATSGDLNTANDTAVDPTVVSPTPSPTFLFVPSTLLPASQTNMSLRLISPFPHDVTGSVSMVFESRAAIPVDDPAIQFEAGGRTVSFTIPAGATQARFDSKSDVGPVGFQTGTVAGKLTFSGTLTAGTVQKTISPSLGSLSIAVSPPIIQSVQTSNQGGFVASILLYSTKREVTEVNLTFSLDAKLTLSCGTVAGCSVSGDTLTFDVESLFENWFMSDTTFGSLSQLRIPLSIGGGKFSGQVFVTLRNSLGLSNVASFNLN